MLNFAHFLTVSFSNILSVWTLIHPVLPHPRISTINWSITVSGSDESINICKKINNKSAYSSQTLAFSGSPAMNFSWAKTILRRSVGIWRKELK